MMKFLRAVGAALTAAFKVIGRLATAPLRMLGNFGGGYEPVTELPEPTDPAERDAEVAQMERRMAEGLTLANILMTHCAHSVIEDRNRVMMPREMPAELCRWVRGLSRDEATLIMASDEKTVSAHIRGLFQMKGVRKVQSLPPTTWEPLLSDPTCDFDHAISDPAFAR